MLCSCEVFVRMVVMLISCFLWLTQQTSNICKGAPLVDALQPTGNVCLPAIAYVADDQDWDDFSFVLNGHGGRFLLHSDFEQELQILTICPRPRS